MQIVVFMIVHGFHQQKTTDDAHQVFGKRGLYIYVIHILCVLCYVYYIAVSVSMYFIGLAVIKHV